MLRTTRVWTMVLALGAVAGMLAGGRQDIDVTGAWSVTITMPSGSVSGLAILSQDGGVVTGMIGPAETDMMPAGGTVEGGTLTLETRPRAGRTAAFATCVLTGTRDRMIGTIDTDKGTIEFTRKPRRDQ
jgi:hypothetical protein